MGVFVQDNKLIIDKEQKTISSSSLPLIFDKEKITEIIFEEGLERIEDNTFNKFKNVKRIVFPNTLKSIGKNAFHEDFSSGGNLTEVTLNEGLEYIGENAFLKNPIRNIYIPSTVKEIGKWAFEHLNEITVSKENPIFSDCDCNVLFNNNTKKVLLAGVSPKIPNDTKIIEDGAFQFKQLADTIIFPSSLEEIGEGAFLCCSIKKIEFNKGLKRIKRSAFNNDQLLSDINELPDTLEEIGEMAFKNCYSLKKIKMNCDMKILRSGVFSGCENLETIYVNSIDKTLDFYKYHKDKIKLPDIDSLISEGKSIKDINKILKDIER